MEIKFECPLCKSSLSKSRYYEIVGVWEEKKKFEKDLQKQLDVAKQIKEKALKEKKEIQEKLTKEKVELKKQFEKQKAEILKKAQEEAKTLAKKDIDKAKLEIEKKARNELKKAEKEFLARGKEHEKKRMEKMNKMLDGKVNELQTANKMIKELNEQIKKGTTPQMEGLNFEEELVKELKAKFPEDDIQHKGHAGDILHYIMYKNKQIGLIVYECKKTQKFQNSYISQIKADVAKREATYGVLVTDAPEKDKAGFWVKDDILIVHPFGTIYIAEVIRKWIISLYAMKLSEVEMSECAKKLLEYIKGNKFKNSVRDTIDRIRQLNELLNKEMTTHKNLWEKRHKHYNYIHNHASSIERDSLSIIRNEGDKLEEIREEEPKIELLVSKRKIGDRER